MHHIELTDAEVLAYKAWVARMFGRAKVANYGIFEQ